MLRSSFCSVSVVLLAATSFAQRSLAPQVRPITAPIQYAGVLHLATGTWTQGSQGSQPVAAPGILYDNTCTPTNYLPMPVNARLVDEGRLPAMDSVVIPNTNSLGNDSEVGTQNSYTIDGFRIAYCTKAATTRSYNVNFYQAYNTCSVPPVPATAAFAVNGLPGSATAGTLACWIVDIDLSDCNAGGAPLSFDMQADADGTYNAGVAGAGDTFGWSFQLTSTPANADGFIIAGGKPTTPGASYTTCSGSDGTVFDSGTVSSKYPDNSEALDLGPPPTQCGTLPAGATPEAGSGMGTQDGFRVENWPGFATGCYTNGSVLMGSYYLQIYCANVELPSQVIPPVAFCDPGVAGILACPCSNPPSGPGRGCNNSVNTGGAVMTFVGVSSLSTPTLSFTSTGEKPTSGSILIQGTLNTTGLGFGQGVRCTGGVVKRLFFHQAVAGTVTLPNFSLGDLDIPTRSAALGNPINAGENRWYQVYYRDGVVVGGCAASLQFNVSNGFQATWN